MCPPRSTAIRVGAPTGSGVARSDNAQRSEVSYGRAVATTLLRALRDPPESPVPQLRLRRRVSVRGGPLWLNVGFVRRGRPGSCALQEPQVERPEHQDNPNVHHQALPEPMPEEQDVHAYHDG